MNRSDRMDERIAWVLAAVAEAGRVATASELLKFRNIGPVTVAEMRRRGLVVDSPFLGLSHRTANALEKLGLKSKDDLRALFRQEGLRPGCIVSLGWASYNEVRNFLGLRPRRDPALYPRCPHCGRSLRVNLSLQKPT